MTTRDIRPSTAHTSCEVCGRTLLRGERAHVYLDGAARRSVCELCTSRAVNEGWVREGTVPPFDGGDTGADRRRSLLHRLRRRREPKPDPEVSEQPIEEDGEEPGWAQPLKRARERIREEPFKRAREPAREPRHVRAVPTSVEHKISSAVDLFNSSEHRRTVSGVARSLGLPAVHVHPVVARPSIVNLVIAWELCWYRYEVDLSDDVPSVRLADQGSELEELSAEERQPNAISDENGSLALGTRGE